MRLNLTKFIVAALMLIFAGSFTLKAQSSGTEDAIMQGFYWNTHPGDFSSDMGLWWDTIASVAPDIANGGIKTVWTPPANKGFAGTFDMGYGVYDYYDFGSFFQKGTLRTRHGNASQLFNTIDVLHQNNLKVMGDLVLNHRAGAEETQPEECDHQNDGILEDRFTKFRPASGRAPMNAEDFHPTDVHCDLFGPYHDRVFFEDLCYFEDIDQVFDPTEANNGWYHGPHNLGRAGDSLIAWGRYLLDDVGFDELRLDAVKHIEPGFLAPFLVEMAAGDQPFAVGELFDGDIGTLKGYRDQVEAFNTTFGAGSKDASIAIFDFNLRFAIRDFCNNTSGGYDMWNLNNAGLLFNGMPGEDIVTFVENHDFDRVGYVLTDCNDPDVVAQEGSTCLKFSIDSGHDPVISDKHLGYAYITAAEGRPSIFWKDWFWFGLKEEIKWQLALRADMASGSSTPIASLNPFFSQGNGGDMFVINRNGNNGEGGLVLALNDHPNTEASAFVNTPFSNVELKDYSDAYMFTQTAAFGDSRAQVKAQPRNYAWYAPTGRYPTPPDAEPSAFTLGNHQGAKLHFIAIRAEDAANLLVNGAPIEVGDQIAVRPIGGSEAVGIGRIGQSFEWDGGHDMIFEVLGGGNASEAKGGLLNGDAFELLVFDKSTGTTEVIATLDFAAIGTAFTFDPLRPGSKGGSFALTTTHSDVSYQVGAISLITAFDTRPQDCVSTDAAAPAYDDGWQSGDANGTGFGSWSLGNTNNAGHFTASSTGNGNGDSNLDGDIDTGGRAWGMFANSGGQSDATLDFSQPLAQGGIFSLKMDNGFVDGAVGFSLKNAAGADLLSFFFQGGNANYTLNDQNGASDTGVGYTDEGLEISLSLTSATDFEMIITRLEDGSTTVLNGVLNLPATGTQQISRLFLFNNNAGFNASANLYFNNLEICSTPACPIAGVNAGVQSVCNPVDNTYSQEITVNFNTTPTDGQLSVNGMTVPLNVVNGTQTLTLTGLISDGNEVDVTVVLTGSEACTLVEEALFTAPADCQLPQITCPGNMVVDTDPELCTANASYEAPEGTDNIAGASTQLSSGQGSGADFMLGVSTETYTVTDAAGNQNSCSFTITVNDMEAPTASCQNVVVNIDADGTATAVAADINDGSFDNCTTAENLSFSLIEGQLSYTCYDIGNTYDVTLQVADEANNTSTCTSQVTIADGNSNCVAGETLDFDGDDDYVDFGDINDFGTSDFTIEFWFNASSIVPANSLGGTYLLAKGLTSAGIPSGAGYGFRLNIENGQNELSFIIGSPSNKVSFDGINTNTWYHVAGVRKGTTLSLYVDGVLAQSENTGSIINVNTNLSLGLGAVIRAPLGPNTTSFDGKIDEVRIWGEAFCQDEVVNYTSCALSGSETGLLAHYDFNQGFAGVDNSPENILLDRTGNGNDGSLINFDLDGNASNWLAPGITQSGNCLPYVDNTNPVINCPTTVTVNTDPDLCTANVTYAAATASDNCGDVTITYSQNSGTSFQVGTTIVTATATDDVGNQNQCTFSVEVSDNEKPSMVCKQNFTLQLTGATTTITTDQVDNNSTDNCGITNLSLDNNTFTCSTLGPQTVTLTGTDAAGNSSSCQTTITVEDNNPPTAVCANPTVNLEEGGIAIVAASLFDGGSSAVCGDVSFSADITEFDCDDVGNTVSVTLTVTAQTNNETATCTSMVTVTDTNSECCAPANAVCNNTTVELNASGMASIIPGDVGGGSTAECGSMSESVTPMNFTCADIGNPVTVMYTIEDINGASSSCTAEVTVKDNIPPTPVCKTTTVELSPDNGMYTLLESDVYDANASSDNCSIDNLSFLATTYDCDDEDQTFTIPVTVTDAGGNNVSCDAMVTVVVGDALPNGWSANDVGNSGFLGNEYSFEPCTGGSGEFAITGGGNNATSSTTDNVAFASQTLCGNNVSITAKIESVTPNGYGGLMIRETTAAGAKQVAIFSNMTYVLRHETRYTTNGPKQVNAFYKPAPFWLRLTRMGDWIFAYYSNNGVNFSYVHGVFVPMQSCVEVGLASFTYLPGQQTTTVFSNVTVTGANGGMAVGDNDAIVPSVPPSMGPYGQHPNTKAPNNLKLYPNPTRDIVNLVFEDGLNKDATISLRNQLGQVVEQRQLRAGDFNTEWNVSTLADGLYLFEIRQEGEAVQVLRLVKTQ